ncbi:hypothetical protein [Silvimonas soli]|nr:hypothetical protein [Silvimonas soli]
MQPIKKILIFLKREWHLQLWLFSRNFGTSQEQRHWRAFNKINHQWRESR